MANQPEVNFKASPGRKLLWALLMLGIGIGAGIVLWRSYQLKQAAILAEQGTPAVSTSGSSDSSTAPTTATATPAEEFVSRAETTVEFPPLPDSPSASDGWLRQEVPLIDQNPELAQWLNQTDDLVRRFVVLVRECAQGKVASKLFTFWTPQEPLQVQELQGGEYVLDPASYHRYDRLALAVEGLDVELGWQLYQRLKPWIEQVYAEFSPPGSDFDQVFLQAIENLLQTPQPQGEIRLTKPSVTYQYADPQLEALSPAQKLLLRMGPVNAAIVKHKLSLLRNKLLKKQG